MTNLEARWRDIVAQLEIATDPVERRALADELASVEAEAAAAIAGPSAGGGRLSVGDGVDNRKSLPFAEPHP